MVQNEMKKITGRMGGVGVDEYNHEKYFVE